jgi:hypothetical protein
MTPTTPRRLRAARAAQRWAEVHIGPEVLVEPELLARLEDVCADSADHLGRDVTPGECAAGCSSVVAAYKHDREQREAEEAIASARETERLEYLRRRAADYALNRDLSKGHSK